ncbi:MAG TPA: YceI family protein [Cyclobacteriaceae bacterium]|nr:YceI family protein [Cyclobacteriaceae bacterium]
MKIYKDEKVIRWRTDPVQSEICFDVRHLMVSRVNGRFRQYEAHVLTNGDDFSTADIMLKITSKSITTDDSILDAYFKGPDCLNVDQYKQIIFASTSLSQRPGTDNLQLGGDLTIAGVTRNINLEMKVWFGSKDAWGDTTASLLITGKIARADWGVKWTTAMESAGFLVGDEIIITWKMELINPGQHDAQKRPDPVAVDRVGIR